MEINFVLKNYKNFKNHDLLNEEMLNIRKDMKYGNLLKKGDKIKLKYKNMIINSEVSDITIDMIDEEPIYEIFCEIRKIEKEENHEQ